MRHDVALYFLRIDEVSHAELLGHGLALRVDIDTDDHVGAGHARALDHIQADAAQTKHNDVRTRLYLGGLDNSANARGHATADITHLLERGVLANLGHGDLGQYGVFGERRAAHVVMDLLLTDREAARAVRHDALTLSGANRSAEVGLMGGA